MKTYSLEFGKPARLAIFWDGGWYRVLKNIDIRFDKEQIGFFPERSQLEQGQKLQLPDGSTVNIQLQGNDFNIFHHGKSIQLLNLATQLREYAILISGVSFITMLLTLILKKETFGITFSPSFVITGKEASTEYLYAAGIGFTVIALLYLAEAFLIKYHYFYGALAFIVLMFCMAVTFDLVIPAVKENKTIIGVIFASLFLGIKLHKIQKQGSKENMPVIE